MAVLFVKGKTFGGHARRSAKYRNRWTEYNGQQYQSKKEAEYAARLDLMLLAKKIRGWQRQVRVALTIESTLICYVIVDFLVTHLSGSTEYVEVKSAATMTPVWKLKWKLFEVLYPELKKRIVC